MVVSVVAWIFVLGPAAHASIFDGTGRVEVADPSGALSWNVTANSLTVSCWFKLSVPTGVTLTKNMVILANARSSGASGAFAYLIQFNRDNGNVEFTAGGANGPLAAQTLVERPYLDRWYHVAVSRSGGEFTGYLDGRRQFTASNNIGSSTNTNGLFIGGTPDDTAHLYGEVQEVAIYQSPLTQDVIAGYMFLSQPTTHPTLGALLRGYFKLGGTPNPDLANYASTPPAGTNPATKTGGVTFEEANQAGEQSTFDSRKNGGRDALAALSGSFAWERTLLRRSTTGVPFEFKIGYRSSNAYNGLQIPQFSPFDSNGLGPAGAGWSHTFDARIIPSDKFEPLGTNTTLGLLMWDGSLEVWETADDINYTPRHGEYRGELKKIGAGVSAVIEWTTPDRLIYRFHTPFANAPGESAMRGRLVQIRDLNPAPNAITVDWDRTLGRVTAVTDTAGGVCRFKYDTQSRLEYVGYLGADLANPLWKASFTYNAQNRLATLAISGPANYTATPALPTTWGFYYKTSTDATNTLLEKIADPRGYNSTAPAFYEVQLTYDKYGRVIEEKDALNRAKLTKYNFPANRQVSRADAVQAALPEATRKYWVETFDRKSRVTERKDPLGNKTSYEYDAAGNVSAAIDANANRTEFTYDSRANILTKKVVPLNETTTWRYDAVAGAAPNTIPLNQPSTRIDPAAPLNGGAPVAWESNFEYDTAGHLKKQSDALGTLVANTYTAKGQLETTTDANGNVTSFTYTPEGWVNSKTVPDEGATTRTFNYTYTELGWLKTEKNPLNQTATYTQDINGRVVSVLDPLGRTYAKTYDASGNLTAETDGLGRWTYFGYDNVDQKISMTQRDHTAAAPRVWSYSYTLRGEPFTIRDPLLAAPANTIEYAYDDAGRRTKDTDANGFFSSVEYDANGNVRFAIDREGKRWEKRYDALNRVTHDLDPEGDTTITAYDPAGRIATVTTPRGHVSSHDYDGRGRLTRWLDAERFPWRYFYDGNANITKITDALNGDYVMTYGPRNERLTEKNQDLKNWTYTYDELLRLKTQTDPNGTRRTVFYDEASRIERVVFSTGREAQFFYDNNNNPWEIRRVVAGQTTKTVLSYDTMDRVLSAKDAFNQIVGYGYDAAGRLKTTVYPGDKTLTRGYDLGGRLETLTDWATPARVSRFTYDKAGRLKTHLYPNGITTALGYDQAGRVTSLDHGSAATPQQIALRYAYDRNGNKTSETKKGTLAWQPGTAAGQVTLLEESYTPTAAGRLVSSTDALNSARNFTYSYDESGNMRRAQSPGATYDFTYDEDNRVTTVGHTAGATTNTIANRYDALGRRLARTLNGVETRYVLDFNGEMERILADTDAAGAITARYVHSPDGLGYREDVVGAITCYHADAMGNIIRLTDGSGGTVADYTYSPFGRVLASTGTVANLFRFVGSLGVMEELPNLYFMRARYYSADVGVFLSTDPVRKVGAGWRPTSYLYADLNPLRSFDPKGEMSKAAHARYIAALQESVYYGEEASAWLEAENRILGAAADAVKPLSKLAMGDFTGAGIAILGQAAGGLDAFGFGGATALRDTEEIAELAHSAIGLGVLNKNFDKLMSHMEKIGGSASRISAYSPDGPVGSMYAGVFKPVVESGFTKGTAAILGQMGGSPASATATSPVNSNGAKNASVGAFSFATTMNSVQSNVPKTGGVTTPAVKSTSISVTVKTIATKTTATVSSAVKSAVAAIKSFFSKSSSTSKKK